MRLSNKKMIATGLLGLSLMISNVYAEDSKPAAPSATVATVNGEAITQETLDTVLMMVRSAGQGDKITAQSVLDDLVLTELARQEASKSDIAQRDDIKNKIKDFTDKLVLEVWTQEKAKSFPITDEELKAAYDKQIAENKYEYKARHILMKTREEAEGVIKDLAKGTDFADLAKKSSDGPSAGMGGDLGWFKPGTMVKPFAEAVAKMEPGTVSKEPVQTEFGWHVIKLEERREAKLPEFASAKEQLRMQLEQQKLMDYIKEARSKADVKIMLPEEKPVADKAGDKAAAEPAKADDKAAAEPAKTEAKPTEPAKADAKAAAEPAKAEDKK